MRYQLRNSLHIPIEILIFEILKWWKWWCGPFTLIAKNRELECPLTTFSPLVQGNMSDGSYKLRVWRSNGKG